MKRPPTGKLLRRPVIAAGEVVLALSLGTVAGAASTPAGRPAATATVAVDAATRYQHIAGFGVSEGFGQAKPLMDASTSVQQRVLSLLFSPSKGAGLTILRNEISADKGFTIEPKAPSSPGATPSYLSLEAIDQDQGQLWLARKIKADYGVSDVFADAWSAPAFMKVSNSAFYRGPLCGAPGASCARGDWRQAYANYLVQYARDYAAAGIPLTYVGPLNEPHPLPPGVQAGGPVQDSMTMSAAQTVNFMALLGTSLAHSGLSTRAECCASISWQYAQQYATAIAADKAANSATSLFTSHGYFLPLDSPLRGWNKPVWQTEWAPFGNQPWDPAWDDGSLSSGFTWAQNIYTGLTEADLSAFLYLWGASMTGPTGPNTGLVYVTSKKVATSGRLWAFASFSRFVRPGAVRIGATASGSALEASAFRNSDGSTALVVLNSAHTSRLARFSLHGVAGARVVPYVTDTSHDLAAQAAIAVHDGTFTSTVPPRGLVTFVLRG